MEERLRKFACVVETGSFTRSASELHISQPALSIAIRKLEHELGTTVFEHRQQPLKLTAAGETAYRYAKSLGARNRNFKLELDQLMRQKPSLAIGMIDSVAYTLFVQTGSLDHIKQQADVSLSINNSRILTHLLQRGELDMALVTQYSSSVEQYIRLRPLGNEPLFAVTSPDNMNSVKEALGKGSLPELLSYDQNSNTDHLISQYFMHRGIELHHTFRSTSPEILLHMSLSGEGTAVLPYVMIGQAIKQRQLVTVAGPIARPIVALEYKDRETSLPLLTLCKHIQKTLEALNAEGILLS